MRYIRRIMNRLRRRRTPSWSDGEIAVSTEETRRFIADHLRDIPCFDDRFSLLSHSLSFVNVDGSYCEFGVYRGSTINFIAERITQTIHGFDSFDGLPEDWVPGAPRGTFATKPPPVRSNVTLHKGWFNETLPAWKLAHLGPIAFMHVDCDLYSATKTVFDALGDCVVAGTVIQFDEYFNYPGWQQGEFKAFAEFVESRHLSFEYVGYTKENQASVRIA